MDTRERQVPPINRRQPPKEPHWCAHNRASVMIKALLCHSLCSSSVPILANRPDLVGTVLIWRPKPDVPSDDPKSRFVPINAQKHDFKPAFCLFFLFFNQDSSFFCVFWPFFMYPSVVGCHTLCSKFLNLACLEKSTFNAHFNARNTV